MSVEQRDALSWWERRALDLGLMDEFSSDEEGEVHEVGSDAGSLAGLGVTVEKAG